MNMTVGEAICRTLEDYGVGAVYGVISIHNLPIADALGQRNQIRFVPARGEAGAATMADAHTRVGNLAVALTSTGAGAGNAAGALMEAMNANTPMLHLTGQVESAYLDRDAGFIHETRDQLSLLRACSKAAYRVMTAEEAVPTLHKAIQEARTVPCGPVSIEIPVDIQSQRFAWHPQPVVSPLQHAPAPAAQLDALVDRLLQAQRPVLWVGGGARDASNAVRSLADAGIAVVSSTHGRGILPDSHPRSLRAFHSTEAVQALYKTSDLMVVAGSRLRSNETMTYSVQLPRPLVQIDANPRASHRNYAADEFICGDCQDLIEALAARLQNRKPNADFDRAIQDAVAQSESALRQQLGVYARLSDAVRSSLQLDDIFVRDITVSGSTWGGRLLPCEQPRTNIHSLAGAIGLGLAMGIGCAIAQPNRRVLALVGDGGLALGLGEIATMVQEQLNMTLLIMNDGGYGVMRGIQEKYFENRQYFNDLHCPNFPTLAKAMGLPAWQITQPDDFEAVLKAANSVSGPAIVEVDMKQIGPLKFAGPPQKKLY